MTEIAGAIREVAKIVSIWMSGAEKRRKSRLNRSIEELFDILEKDNITEKLFKHYKKRIRAYL